MDRSDLIKITVTAVITACARELVVFVFKQGKIAATTLKPVATNVFKRHRKIIPAILDLLVICIIGYFFWKVAHDTSTATRRFVVLIAFVCLMTVRMFHFLKLDVRNYISDLKNQIK